jgi:ferredoxin/flavodoxin---NADP+ reductase
VKKELPKAKVVYLKDLTPDLMIMKLELPDCFKTFKPGQFCTLKLPGTKPNAYSIVSSPNELPIIELFIELVPDDFKQDDSLTPEIWKLRVGREISIYPKITGTFVLEPQFDTHVFVSTVTGVAPFVSMLRAYYEGYYGNRNCRFHLLQGASYRNEFGYFKELGAENDRLAILYIPTVSRPKEVRNKGWFGKTGRVNEIVEDHLSYWNIGTEGTCVYVCGNEGMIEDLTFGRTKREMKKVQSGEKKIGRLVQAGYTTRAEVFF